MNRPLRLVAGWSIALVAALLLNLAMVRPTTAPPGVVLSGELPASPNPTVTPLRDPIDRLPPIVVPPGGETGSGSARPVELAPLSDSQAATLQAAADRARLAFHLDALAIGVSIGGSSGWTGASGLARDGFTSLDGDSPFAIASITKTFTAAVALQLVEEGRLSLGQEVRQLLPDVQAPAGVKVGQLLRHTSGIADLLNPLRDRLNAATDRLWHPDEVVAAVGQPWFAPGAAWAYSNTNYVLLGMIVEKVTGQSFAHELRERILAPLELSSTGLLLGEGAPPLMTPSWASAFGASGSMYASADDLLRWGDALYGGRVLGSKALKHMLDFKGHGYGMGAEKIPIGGVPGYGHSGLLRGYTSLVVHLPEPEITLVLMGTTNMFDPARVLAHREARQPSILDLAQEAAGVEPAAEVDDAA
jgi:D-alanyl-D-alanine carboxypeptidase